MSTFSQKIISCFFVLFFLVFANNVAAIWQKPILPSASQQSLTDGNTEQAINVGSNKQTKAGFLELSKISGDTDFESTGFGWIKNRIWVGINPIVPRIAYSVITSGDVGAPSFCLGVSCISSWQDGLGLVGGQRGSLVKWLGSNTIGNSSISESVGVVAIGTSVNKKTAIISGALNLTSTINNDSGLTLKDLTSILTPAELSALAITNVVLSVDTATGEVILVEACKP